MLTHPIDEDAARFYLRFGFEPSPIREQQLLLLLKDARRLISGQATPTVSAGTSEQRRAKKK